MNARCQCLAAVQAKEAAAGLLTARGRYLLAEADVTPWWEWRARMHFRAAAAEAFEHARELNTEAFALNWEHYKHTNRERSRSR